MAADLKVETRKYMNTTDVGITAMFQDTVSINANFAIEILGEIATKIADRYVEEHYAEIVAKLDQNAIASLAIADAGKKIAEEIRSKPSILHDKETRTEVYERSFFGGTRRVR